LKWINEMQGTMFLYISCLQYFFTLKIKLWTIKETRTRADHLTWDLKVHKDWADKVSKQVAVNLRVVEQVDLNQEWAILIQD
jgi:hypothetical protein